jgi:hypothetical protein
MITMPGSGRVFLLSGYFWRFCLDVFHGGVVLTAKRLAKTRFTKTCTTAFHVGVVLLACVAAQASQQTAATSTLSSSGQAANKTATGSASTAKAPAHKKKHHHTAASSSTASTSAAKPAGSISSTHTASSRTASSRTGSSRKKKTARTKGQQKIDSDRAQEIQDALIREHYLNGEATGKWNDASEAAMRKYQGDHGWQTKTVPDSRALIKLGLGPSHDHLLNPESAMTTGPDAPRASAANPAAPHADPPSTVSPPSEPVSAGPQ